MTFNATSDSKWQKTFALMVLPAFALFALGMSRNNRFLFSDGDTNWHVATGRWILSHGAVPATDPFSYTAAGQPWITHEWLSEVFMALAYAALGWNGVALLTSLAAATVAVLLANELRKQLGAVSVSVILIMSAVLFLPHYLARPHVIGLPLMVFWTIQIMQARRQDRSPPWWLIPLMALWANLHGSFIFGLAFTSFFALEAVLAARTKVEAALPAEQSRHEQDISTGSRANIWIQREISLFCSREVQATALRWGAFLAAAIYMTLITPGGLKGFLYPFHVISMQNLPSIDEWRAENFQKPSALQFVLFCTLAVCLSRGVRMGAARLALLLLLVYMSLQHMRQEFILAVIAPLLLAEPLALALGSKASMPAASPPSLRDVIAPAAVMGTLFLALTLWRLASPGERIDQATVPVNALAHVPPDLRAKPVFNDYGFGGWLIFQGVKPFMDGRSDMYGDDLLKVYLDVSSGDRKAIDRAMSRYDIRWSILQPSSPLVTVLDARPGWSRIYADKWAVVQARTRR